MGERGEGTKGHKGMETHCVKKIKGGKVGFRQNMYKDSVTYPEGEDDVSRGSQTPPHSTLGNGGTISLYLIYGFGDQLRAPSPGAGEIGGGAWDAVHQIKNQTAKRGGNQGVWITIL